MGNRNVSGSHSQPLLQQLTEPTSKPELKSCTLAESSLNRSTREVAQPQNVIFWGAGATAALGIRTTVGQEQFIRLITGVDDPSVPLTKRVAKALGPRAVKPWHSALIDLITILGDNEGSYNSITDVTGQQLNAMRRNWQKGASDKELRGCIVDLRLTYDWPALKSGVSVCPGSKTDRFKLNDLFNLLDMHIPTGFGFRAPTFAAISGSKRRAEENSLMPGG
jgi:hypothetical protein